MSQRRCPVAGEAGVRLISPDRPGVGLSDPIPGAPCWSWAYDVEELLDRARCRAIAVMGWSMDGQYAAAVGHALRAPGAAGGDHRGGATADRVGCVRRAAGDGPVPAPACRSGRRGRAAVVPDHGLRPPRVTPMLYGCLAARTLGRPTARSSATRGSTPFAGCHARRAAAAGHRRGVPGVDAAVGIYPEELTYPSMCGRAAEDRSCRPSSWPQRLAARIPMRRCNIRDGGHFIAHLHYREIFDALRNQ